MGHVSYANATEAQAQKIITHSTKIQALRCLHTSGYRVSQPGHLNNLHLWICGFICIVTSEIQMQVEMQASPQELDC